MSADGDAAQEGENKKKKKKRRKKKKNKDKVAKDDLEPKDTEMVEEKSGEDGMKTKEVRRSEIGLILN